jgi:hypothetical protein
VAGKLIKQMPMPLLDELKQGRLLPIVGAGFSKNAHVLDGRPPLDWNELGQALAGEMFDFQYDTPLDAISAYEQAFGRAVTIDRVSELIRASDATPGRAHLAFSKLAFENVITTNFDMLLERAYDQVGRPCMPLVDEFQLSARNAYVGPRLIKMHGDVLHPRQMVLTEDDYDGFLSRHPLLATSIGALLINHTAMLVGYSLDDPDTRQILSLIKDRLGKLARPLWAVQVNAPMHIVSKYQRRGVNVINLEKVDGQSYEDVLADLFDELRVFLHENLVEMGQSADEDALASLKMPAQDSMSCYFAVPFELLSIYREYLFGIVREFGLTPVAARDIRTPPGTELAKVDALIERATLVVVDVGSQYGVYEALQAVHGRSPRAVLVIAEHGSRQVVNVANVTVIYRPVDAGDIPDAFVNEFRAWFKRATADLGDIFDNEAQRLYDRGEFRAAVIACVTRLERVLAKALAKFSQDAPLGGVRRMLDAAVSLKLLSSSDAAKVRIAISSRNAAVHSNQVITQQEANGALTAVDVVIRRLEQ